MNGENIIADLNTLYEAFRVSMKGSSWKEEPQRFEIDFLSELVRLKRELESRTYQTAPGTPFLLHERGKIRYIHGSRIRDRVVRHALCDNVLGPALAPYLIPNNGASRKGKGLSFARERFARDLHNYWREHRTNDGYLGFLDLSKFFDNIRHDKVRELTLPKLDAFSGWLFREILDYFRIDVSYLGDDEYAHCLERKFDSIRYHEEIPAELRTGERWMAKSVDIGDQVSQDIGTFFPTRLDNYAKIVRGCKRYGRYMDDIYLITRTRAEAESILTGIAEQAAELGLFVNEKKTRIVKLSATYTYLQVKYSLTETGRVIRRIHPKTVTRERRKLKAYKRLFDRGKMPYEDIEQAYKSWMGAYTNLMSKKQIQHMKQLFWELFGKEPRWKK